MPLCSCRSMILPKTSIEAALRQRTRYVAVAFVERPLWNMFFAKNGVILSWLIRSYATAAKLIHMAAAPMSGCPRG